MQEVLKLNAAPPKGWSGNASETAGNRQKRITPWVIWCRSLDVLDILFYICIHQFQKNCFISVIRDVWKTSPPLLVIHKLKYHLSHRWVTYGSRKELINIFTTSHRQQIKRFYLCILFHRRNSEAPSLRQSPFSACLERSFWHLRGTLPRLFWVLSKVHQWPAPTRVPECILCVLTGLTCTFKRALRKSDDLSQHPNTEKLTFTLELMMGLIDHSWLY